MKRFKTILVKINEPNDPAKDLALLRAIDLSKRENAKLILMDVITPSEGILSNYEGIISPDELGTILVTQRTEELDKLVENLKEKGTDAISYVVQGKSFVEIIKAMLLFKADLLIKEANPKNNSYDSVDFNLMRKSTQPIWLIKPDKELKNNHVLASIDLLMEQDAEGRGLNQKILDIARLLSNTKGVKLTVISCWSLYGEQALIHGAFTRIPEDQVLKLLKQEEQEYQDRFTSLLEDIDDVEINKVLVKGDPKKLIPQYVNENDVDIVVMGTIGRTGIHGMLIGNTSETILQSINSSIITLKPDKC